MSKISGRKPLALIWIALIALTIGACTPDTDTESDVLTGPGGPCDVEVSDTALYNRLFEKISARQPDGKALYQTWPVYPGTPKMKRLGLAVHGRWTTAYVDPDHAFPFLQAAIENGHPQPLELPPGSVIVKENYRSSADATTISPDQSALEVLTVMYKPLPDEVAAAEGSMYPFPCITDHLEPYNGDPSTGCLGGRWFWAFYKVKQDDPTTCETDGPGKLLNTRVNTNLGSFCVHCHAPSFRTDYLRILDLDLNPPRVAPGPPPKPPVSRAPTCDLTLSPKAPADVPVDPLQVWAGSVEAAKSMFDCFGWQTFVALSWPADPDDPGHPDTSRSILDVHGSGEGPVVWQTYFPVYGLFQPGDVDWDPPAFDQPPVPDAPNCEVGPGERVVTLATKARDIPNETGQAFAGTFGDLRDRNKNLVWYEVLINEAEYDYILAKGLFATQRLTPSGAFGPGGTELFPVSFPFDAKTGGVSIEAKSAWKQLCTEPGCLPVDDPNDYFTQSTRIYDAVTGKCSEPVQMGLVGLHITARTFWAPQWVAVTFEHKSNAPNAGNAEQLASNDFSFHNPKLPEPPGCFRDPFLMSPAGCPNVTLNRFQPLVAQASAGSQGPSLPPTNQPNQMTRLVPTDSPAQVLNGKFQGKLAGTPFENYFLVDVQWPLNGQAGTPQNPQPRKQACEGNQLGDNCFQLVPQFLRNTVIESYMTTYELQDGEPTQVSNRSCLNCHVTTGTNSSYVWLDAVANRVPVSGGVGP